MKKIVWFVLFIFCFNFCFADTIIFNDGSKKEGTVVEESPTQVLFNVDNGAFNDEQNTYDKKIISRIVLSEESRKKLAKDEAANEVAPNNNLSSITEITDKMLKEQQYNSYVAIQQMQKDTQDMKTIMAWEFGISIACVAIGLIEYSVAVAKSSGH
jgi:hypothetical protein